MQFSITWFPITLYYLLSAVMDIAEKDVLINVRFFDFDCLNISSNAGMNLLNNVTSSTNIFKPSYS